MNRSEFEALVAEKSGIARKDVSKVLDAAIDGIAETLRRGEEIRLVGFGTFGVKETAEREGRNPRTGETMKIAASRRPSFKPGKGLADAVKG